MLVMSFIAICHKAGSRRMLDSSRGAPRGAGFAEDRVFCFAVRFWGSRVAGRHAAIPDPISASSMESPITWVFVFVFMSTGCF